MKLKYKEGDIFIISLDNGKNIICQVIFAPTPKGYFRKVMAFCVLSVQESEMFKNDGVLLPISFDILGEKAKVIFSGNQYIKDGTWRIIDHIDLTEEKERLKIFNFAGGLYHGEDEIKRIPVSEYPKYTTMEVLGFGLINKVLKAI